MAGYPMKTTEQMRDIDPSIPIIQSHGMGVDSAAVVVLLVELGIKPNLILMADTGLERPETYQYIEVMNDFLRKHHMPEVTVIRKPGKHATMEDMCLHRDTLPGLAFGIKSCSIQWKIEPMDAMVNHWEPAIQSWARGERPIKIIGYDNGERDRERFAISVDKYEKVEGKFWFWTPLRDAKLDREGCKAIIRNAGLPVPIKSCCWACPAMKKAEVREQGEKHPELNERAFLMEVNAAQGKHGLGSTKGLGRSFSWLEYMASINPKLAIRKEEELQVLADHRGRRYKAAKPPGRKAKS